MYVINDTIREKMAPGDLQESKEHVDHQSVKVLLFVFYGLIVARVYLVLMAGQEFKVIVDQW